MNAAPTFDTNSTRERWKEEVYHACKPLHQYLNDPCVTGIFINPDQRVFIKKSGIGRQYAGFTMKESETVSLIKMTASYLGKVVNTKSNIMSGVLPHFNFRIQVVVPPVCVGPCVAIRKFLARVKSLQEYVDEGRMTNIQRSRIIDAITNRENIIVGGSTDSGKTTFLNALLYEVAQLFPEHRIYLYEDTLEIRTSSNDVVSFEAPIEESVEYVRNALRFDPDRLIFGELRHGESCNQLFKAWIAGIKGGFSTIHANDAFLTLSRIEALLGEVIETKPPRSRVCEAVSLIVHMDAVVAFGPKVNQVMELAPELKGGEWVTKLIEEEKG